MLKIILLKNSVKNINKRILLQMKNVCNILRYTSATAIKIT